MTSREAELPIDALLEHAPFVRRLARALVRDEARAEDLVQETWLAALRRPPADPAHARGWLAAVTRRLALDQGQAEARREHRERATARDEAEPRGPDSDELDEQVELAGRVLTAVRELRPPYREVIWLRYYEGLGPRAIARRQGVPLATVETRLRRGRQLLRGRLASQFEERRAWGVALAALAGLDRPAAVGLFAGAGKLIAATALTLPALVGVGVLVALEPWAEQETREIELPRTDGPPAAVRGSEEVELELDGTPGVSVSRAPAADPPATGGSLAALPQLPAPPAVLEGQVQWEGRDAVDELHVGLVRAVGHLPIGGFVLEEPCGGDGRFTFELSASGEFLLVACARGVPPLTTAVELAAGEHVKLSAIVTGADHPLAGVLHDGLGAPLAGASLTATREEEEGEEAETRRLGPYELGFAGLAFHLRSETTQGDREGRFRFHALGRGTHRVDVRPAEASESRRVKLSLRKGTPPLLVEAPAEDLELVWPEERVRVAVRDEAGPLTEYWITFGPWPGVRALFEGQRSEGSGCNSVGVSSPEPAEIAYHPMSDQGLWIRRHGHESRLLRLSELEPDADGTVQVFLPADGSGSALRIAVGCEGDVWPERISVGLRPFLPLTVSGPIDVNRGGLPLVDGEVLIRDVPPGRYRLEVTPEGATPLLGRELEVEVGSEEATVEVVLELGGLLELVPDRVLARNGPLQVRCLADDGTEHVGRVEGSGPLRAGESALVLPALPAGSFTVELQRGDDVLWSGRARVDPGRFTRLALELPAERR